MMVASRLKSKILFVLVTVDVQQRTLANITKAVARHHQRDPTILHGAMLIDERSCLGECGCLLIPPAQVAIIDGGHLVTLDHAPQ